MFENILADIRRIELYRHCYNESTGQYCVKAVAVDYDGEQLVTVIGADVDKLKAEWNEYLESK